MTGLEESWWIFGMSDKYALWICGVLHMQGSRHSPLDPIMGHHPLHLVANGRDAWDGARQTFWQVPWTGPGSVWEDVGTVDSGTTTASCGGKRGHRVHGGRRPSVENIYMLNCHGCCSKNVGSDDVAEKQYESASLWILIYSSVHLLLVHLPNSIAAISLAAAIMSVRSGISLHSMTQLI